MFLPTCLPPAVRMGTASFLQDTFRSPSAPLVPLSGQDPGVFGDLMVPREGEKVRAGEPGAGVGA